MNYKIDGQQCSLYIDMGIYSIETIHKCFYWYTADFEIDITSANTTQYKVVLISKAETTIDFTILVDRIKQNLIDFKLREIVNKETQTIRELIIAKAFANYEIDVDLPQSEISDPVGFNPTLI